MSTPTTPASAGLPWDAPDWQTMVTAWIDAQLARRGRARSGDPETVRTGIGAAVLRLSAHSPDGSAETLYFKAAAPSFPHEARLTDYLTGPHLPRLLAANGAQNWLLMADFGPTFGQAMRAEAEQHGAIDFEPWEAMLRQFAALQQAQVGAVESLLRLGVPDRRLNALPERFAVAVQDRELLITGGEDSFTEAQYADALGFRPEVERLCASLARYGIPETLHHDDFHPNNIARGADGRFLFFDWAESGVAHPFFSLFMSLRSARYAYNADADTLQRLQTVYLESWSNFTGLSMAQLTAAYDEAARLARLCRALTWHQAVSTIPASALTVDDLSAFPYWLGIFIQDREW